jgi:hypothetical protein
MANIARGFRRIGWVATFPLAAFVILFFFGMTKSFSPIGYTVQKISKVDFDPIKEGATPVLPSDSNRTVPPQTYDEAIARGGKVVSPGRNWFDIHKPASDVEPPKQDSFIPDPDVPEGRSDNIIEMPGVGFAYVSKEVPINIAESVIADFRRHQEPVPTPPKGFTLETPASAWRFTVNQRINVEKLVGLIAGSIAILAAVIQGLISVVAWVVRGFKDSNL